MTIGDIENQARVILLDTYSDAYRFNPIEMFHALKNGIKTLWSVRPDSRYHAMVLVDKEVVYGNTEYEMAIPESFPANMFGVESMSLDSYRGVVLNLDNRWEEALIYYVVHRMYLKDDSDTSNAQLSASYLQMFNASAQT